MRYHSPIAPVVKWISQRSSEPLLWVRILPGALGEIEQIRHDCYNGETCGYGLVVECVLAKDETGVRFSLPAPRSATGVPEISSFTPFCPCCISLGSLIASSTNPQKWGIFVENCG